MDCDFFIDTDEPEIIEEEFKQITIIDNECCGSKMSKKVMHGSICYICLNCAKFFNSYESSEQKKIEESDDFKGLPYGSKSEDYINKLREELNTYLDELNIGLLEEQKNKIIYEFLLIRGNRIPRGKPKLGVLGACIHYTNGYSTNELIGKLKINQKFLTYGIKVYLTQLKPFRGFNLVENITNNLKNINLTKEESDIIKNLILICIGFYIGLDTTIKTKCAGAYWYLMQNRISIEEAEHNLKIKKNTIYKFYDQVIIYSNAVGVINKEVGPSFHNRREELKRFMINNNLPLMQIEKKGRYAKFYNNFIF